MRTTIISDEKLELDEAIKLVGGYVELVRLSPVDVPLPYDRVALVDEDGIPKDLPINREASGMMGRALRGNVLILIGKAAQEGWTWEDLEDDLSSAERRVR